ncbi:UDP-2,4-diacetamido-2,4, 6-trideoxy-beta-L-altropyranose hydrolase [Gammaproteobacteria bacterium]
MQGPLLLRADGGFGIGTGHVMRLLALAEAWREAREAEKPERIEQTNEPEDVALLLGRVPVLGLRQRLADAGVGVWDLLVSHPDPGDLIALSNLAEVFDPAWIVLDGYHFDPDYQEAIRTLGIPVLVLDDMAHHRHYHADLLLNQNAGADELHYSLDTDTRLLLGSRYCMLRPELRTVRSAMAQGLTQADRSDEKQVPRTRRLLVTMGGADHRGLTSLALKAFAHLGPTWEAKVVVGSGAQRHPELLKRAASLPGIEILTDVRDMGYLMSWADLALSAAGTTTWELACLGVPSLLVAVADNQLPVIRAATAAGCAVDLGWWENLTVAGLTVALEQLATNEKQRTAMGIAGRALVDGNGAARVVQAMREYSQGMKNGYRRSF